MRNRAAMASLIVLSLIALACLFGPLLTGHAYDKFYSDYVKVPAALASQPTEDRIGPALQRTVSRLRATIASETREGDAIRLVLTAPRAIDERSLAFFERSDLFHAAKVLERAEEGRR